MNSSRYRKTERNPEIPPDAGSDHRGFELAVAEERWSARPHAPPYQIRGCNTSVGDGIVIVGFHPPYPETLSTARREQAVVSDAAA